MPDPCSIVLTPGMVKHCMALTRGLHCVDLTPEQWQFVQKHNQMRMAVLHAIRTCPDELTIEFKRKALEFVIFLSNVRSPYLQLNWERTTHS